MANVEKFPAQAVNNLIRHIERTIEEPANLDIDKERLEQDYFLSPQRDISSYDYYKERLNDLYILKRPDVNTMCSWIITAPTDLKPEHEEAFFKSCYDFLNERYGEKNCISCTVHKDESGSPHMHYFFIPVVEDKKHEDKDGKVCAKQLLDRRELRNFHPDLQKHLDADGIETKVLTGITKRQGGNRSVRELKQEREEQRQQEREHINRWDTQREQEIKIGRW